MPASFTRCRIRASRSVENFPRIAFHLCAILIYSPRDTRYNPEIPSFVALPVLLFNLFKVRCVDGLRSTYRVQVPVCVTCFVPAQNQVSNPPGIESKEDARKRGQSSPDRAEALVMAFCRVVAREQTVVFGGNYQISAI